MYTILSSIVLAFYKKKARKNMNEKELAQLVRLLEMLKYEVDHYHCKEIDGVIETAKEKLVIKL